MEEKEEEVGTMESSSRCSWLASEGSLEQSVKVVQESEDAIYTAGPTSTLVLTPPPLSISSEKQPCELTVTFQHRLGHVHHIYVVSTARICEIYGQKEEDGDREYVCTVRGEIISLSDDEGSADDISESVPDTPEQEDFTIANFNCNINPVVPSAIPESESTEEVRQQILLPASQAAEVVSTEKMVSAESVDDCPSLSRRDSKDELFRSFTEAMTGREIDESIVFEESLDQANWVECPRSPLKSNDSASDDDTEVDPSTNGFCLVDTDVESQLSDQPQVLLFTDAIRASGTNSVSLSLERNDTGSSDHSSWQEAIQEPVLEDSVEVTSPNSSKFEQNVGEGRKVEECYETPWSQLEDFEEEYNGGYLPGSGFCVFEVNHDLDSHGSAASKATPGKATTEVRALASEVVEANSLESSMQKNGGIESTFPAPVFECEVSLVDADAWRSVTIRLLSVQSKSQVEIHRVVVTYTPGPSIQTRATTSGGSYQPGVGTSSVLAMLVPGILQMARGMSETRKKPSSVSSVDKGNGVSGESPSQLMNVASHSMPPSLPTFQNIALDLVKMNKPDIPPMVHKNPDCKIEDEVPSHSDVTDAKTRETSSSESISHAEARVVHGEESKDSEGIRTVNKETGHLESLHMEDRLDALFQRLDRLETICLRMENSLNVGLENMDKRLQLLELAGPGRMPPAHEHPFWGPGFDSGSFVSGTTVYVPAAHTGSVTPSLVHSHSFVSTVDVPVENSSKGVASVASPVDPSLLSSTRPPSLSSDLPSWALPSWPRNLALDTSSHSSGFTSIFTRERARRNGSRGSLHDSDHASNGGETFWESRTSDASESEISSESEQTSYADNCEDPACGSCPESVSSSPTGPGQLVDNALASALLAFSTSFGAHRKGVPNEFCHSADSGEEDSFTSEEQVPLVELDSFPSYYEKEAVVHGHAETAFLHVYEAIPLSNDRDVGHLSTSKVLLEENFWSSEVDEQQEINWQDERVQTQEKVFPALEDHVNQTEEGTPFQPSSAVLIEISDQPSLPRSTTDDTISAELQKGFQEDAAKETKYVGDARTGLDDRVQDLQQNPFLQELMAAEGRKVRGSQTAWQHLSWTGDQAEIAKDDLSSHLNVRGLSNHRGSTEDMLLQEGLFPDEWNWFTSEFSPFSSLVEVRDLSEDAPLKNEPALVHLEPVNMSNGSSTKTSPSRLETRSLLDDDVSLPSTAEQHSRDVHEQDWPEQKNQWSLIDEYPQVLTGEAKHPDLVSQDGSLGNRQPRSLLDEDIPLPSSRVSDADHEAHVFISHESLLDDLSDVFRLPSKHVDTGHSPPSGSKSNPFEGEHRDRSDLIQGSIDAPLVLLEDFEGEAHQFDAPSLDGTHSLMFYMSL